MRDASVEHTGSGGAVNVGFLTATKNRDPDNFYFTWVEESWGFVLTLEQEGIYLIDSVLTFESWSTGTGRALYALDPSNTYDPFGFSAEQDAWAFEQEWGTGSPWLRIQGIMSANNGCHFQCRADQTTGTTKFAGAYLKAVYLSPHGSTDGWITDSAF